MPPTLSTNRLVAIDLNQLGKNVAHVNIRTPLYKKMKTVIFSGMLSSIQITPSQLVKNVLEDK